jgi:hypothetical protein
VFHHLKGLHGAEMNNGGHGRRKIRDDLDNAETLYNDYNNNMGIPPTQKILAR